MTPEAKNHEQMFAELPTSSGMSSSFRIAFFSAVVLVFIILGLVIFASSFGHVWPWSDSAKVPLTPP